MKHLYDRTAEDLGNIVHLEHVNVTIPDQQCATLFYVTGLGLTRDPYLMTGTTNMWVNVGRSQFHLPRGNPQVLRGHIGLVLPEREALVQRLATVRQHLIGTRFTFSEHSLYVEATCPWGNRIRCYEPQERFGRVQLGMPYVEFEVNAGMADRIAHFYRAILQAPATVDEDDLGRSACISVGTDQDLVFRETDRPLPPYDGHHIQVYIADFSGPHRRLVEKGLITEESDQHQYRFQDLIDLNTGHRLFSVEHEIRSLRHPLYARPLVNRNPELTPLNYVPEHESLSWSIPPLGWR
jgi:hypothetical protein